MNTQNKIDALDEALRVIYLESAKEKESADSEINFILGLPLAHEMSAPKKEELLNKLGNLMQSATLGELITAAMNELAVSNEDVEAKTNIPVAVLQQLKEDTIYTNNVPVTFFTTLLKSLNIAFNTAQKSILKTFELLQGQVNVNDYSAAALRPAFRKSAHLTDYKPQYVKSDGRELYENKEALDKYLNSLDELMKM